MELFSLVFLFSLFFHFVDFLKFLIPSSTQRVVVLSSVCIDIKYFPEPLQELKVVLVLAFDEFFNIDMLHDSQFGESLLQNFEIADELVLELGLPVDFGHGEFAGIENVGELAVDGPRAQLLNFGETGLQKIVDPVEQFSPREVDCIVEIYGYLVDHSS